MKVTSLAVLLALTSTAAFAGGNADEVKRRAEAQVRSTVEPLMSKYCHDQCRLLGIEAQVDLAVPQEVAPGFEDLTGAVHGAELVPTHVKVKLLMDDMIGSTSRQKIIDMIQQTVDGLEYPVSIDNKVARFPQPAASARKIAEMRDKVSRQFKDTVSQLLDKVCPNQCLLGDFDVKAEPVSTEETQYASNGEYVQDGDIAIKITGINGTVLMDDSLSATEQRNIVEMAKLKTSFVKNVDLRSQAMKFPRGIGPNGTTDWIAGGSGRGRSIASDSSTSDLTSNSESSSSYNSNSASTNSTSTSSDSKHNNMVTSSKKENEQSTKQERFEKFEKIERVENGDAVQAEIKVLKTWGVIFASAVISLLLFIAAAGMRGGKQPAITRLISQITSDPVSTSAPSTYDPNRVTPSASGTSSEEKATLIARRYEIERLQEELTNLFAEQPKVAKQVFGRILTEEGVDVTSQYIEIFGESVVLDLLRDPSLQTDLAELMEFYAKNPTDLTDEDKLSLLRQLHNRAVAAKMVVLGNRSSGLFEFLSEMNPAQVLELVRNESLTVKAIVLTQCDTQKRSIIYANLDETTRTRLLTELSRIDHLPKNYIYNVATALKRKRNENPKLNTEALPGSEVLISLLERTPQDLQRSVVRSLEGNSPESARTVKSKLVSLETLRYLKDNQLLDIVLSLKHDELLQFLKGTTEAIKQVIFAKSPKELVDELYDELDVVEASSKEVYSAIERKILNRVRLMASEGALNLVEVNERMFADQVQTSQEFQMAASDSSDVTLTNANARRSA